MSRTQMMLGAARLGLTAVILVGGMACASGGDHTAGAAKPSAPGSEGTASVPIFRCGDRTDGLLSRTKGPLAVSGEFPPRIDRAGDQTFTGTVTVGNSGPRVSGVTSPEADVFVAKAGKIVSTPLPKNLVGRLFDLDSGASTVFAARGTIRPCAAGADEPLPSGSYDVFAMVTINRDDGSMVVVTGGPWPLEVA